MFSDLRFGEYVLHLSGDWRRTETLNITIPFPDLMIDSAGDNELLVAVRSINGSNTITFDPVSVNRVIQHGARVLAPGLSTSLVSTLDIGRVTQAQVVSVAGLSVGDPVRIIRGKSVRMKYSPYYQFPQPVTQVVGRVIEEHTPVVPEEEPVPVPGAEVQLTKVNGTNVQWTDVQGVNIATVETGGRVIVLGNEKDVRTLTNPKGDSHIYFNRELFLSNGTEQDDLTEMTFQIAAAGYTSVTEDLAVNSGERTLLNVQVAKT